MDDQNIKRIKGFLLGATVVETSSSIFASTVKRCGATSESIAVFLEPENTYYYVAVFSQDEKMEAGIQGQISLFMGEMSTKVVHGEEDLRVSSLILLQRISLYSSYTEDCPSLGVKSMQQFMVNKLQFAGKQYLGCLAQSGEFWLLRTGLRSDMGASDTDDGEDDYYGEDQSTVEENSPIMYQLKHINDFSIVFNPSTHSLVLAVVRNDSIECVTYCADVRKVLHSSENENLITTEYRGVFTAIAMEMAKETRDLFFLFASELSGAVQVLTLSLSRETGTQTIRNARQILLGPEWGYFAVSTLHSENEIFAVVTANRFQTSASTPPQISDHIGDYDGANEIVVLKGKNGKPLAIASPSSKFNDAKDPETSLSSSHLNSALLRSATRRKFCTEKVEIALVVVRVIEELHVDDKDDRNRYKINSDVMLMNRESKEALRCFENKEVSFSFHILSNEHGEKLLAFFNQKNILLLSLDKQLENVKPVWYLQHNEREGTAIRGLCPLFANANGQPLFLMMKGSEKVAVNSEFMGEGLLAAETDGENLPKISITEDLTLRFVKNVPRYQPPLNSLGGKVGGSVSEEVLRNMVREEVERGIQPLKDQLEKLQQQLSNLVAVLQSKQIP